MNPCTPLFGKQTDNTCAEASFSRRFQLTLLSRLPCTEELPAKDDGSWDCLMINDHKRELIDYSERHSLANTRLTHALKQTFQDDFNSLFDRRACLQ
jgi:hypothetical protein